MTGLSANGCGPAGSDQNILGRQRMYGVVLGVNPDRCAMVLSGVFIAKSWSNVNRVSRHRGPFVGNAFPTPRAPACSGLAPGAACPAAQGHVNSRSVRPGTCVHIVGKSGDKTSQSAAGNPDLQTSTLYPQSTSIPKPTSSR